MRASPIAVVVAVLVLAGCDAVRSEGPTPTATVEQIDADYIIDNATVLTMDADSSVVEAVAVADGRIVAVGDSADLLAAVGRAARRIDMRGATVLPGFVDPHVHYIQNQTPDLPAMLDDQQVLLSWGRTTVGIPAVIPYNMPGFDQLVASGEQALRIHAYLAYNDACGERLDTSFWDDYTFDRSAERRFTVAGVKVFMDGATCHAPAVSFNLDDAPRALVPDDWSGHGDLFVDADELAAIVREVDARGGQVVAHAIGDRAVEAALDGYESALGGVRSANGHRIDHNTFVRPDLVDRYDEAGVNAVVWAVFNACSEPDHGWSTFLTTDQLGWLRQHRAMLAGNPGLTIAFHSDAPYTEGDPFQQLLGLTEMSQLDPITAEVCPRPSWMDGHQVGMDLALRMMTINGATIMGIGDEVGSIEVGKRADLVVIANNPLEQRGSEVLDNHVMATVVDGAAVWCAEGRLCSLLA